MTLNTLDSQQLTVDATAGGVGVDSTKVTGNVVSILCTLETAQIRYQLDPDTTLTQGGTEGSAPLDAGSVFEIVGQNDILNAKFIRTGGTSGALNIAFQGMGS